jgi:hypothetical protein
MVWEIPWETETVLDLVTQEPGRKLLELRQDLEEIRKNIASPVIQKLAAADYNLDSIHASLEGNAAGKLFQAANHYQQLVSKLIDQAQSNLAVADTHLDNMLMRIDEAAERAGSIQSGTGTGGTVGAAWRTGPPTEGETGGGAGDSQCTYEEVDEYITEERAFCPYLDKSQTARCWTEILNNQYRGYIIDEWEYREDRTEIWPGMFRPYFYVWARIRRPTGRKVLRRVCPPTQLVSGSGGTVGPVAGEETLIAGEIERYKVPCYNYRHGRMSTGLYIRWGHFLTEEQAKQKAEEIASQYPSDFEVAKWTERPTVNIGGRARAVYHAVVRICPPPGVDVDSVETTQETTKNGTVPPTGTTEGAPPTESGIPPVSQPPPTLQPVSCPPPQVSCPAPQVTCPTPAIQVVLQCPAGGSPIGTGPTPTPTPVGPPIWPSGTGGPPIGTGQPSTGGPPIAIPPFNVPPFGGPPTGFGPPSGGPPSTGGPPINIPLFDIPPFGGPPTQFQPSGGTGTGGTTNGTTTTTTTGGPPTPTGTGGDQCILPVLQPGSIVRHYEQGSSFDDMKLKGDSIVAGARTAKPQGQFSYMICQCGQTFILIVFEVVTTDTTKCESLVAESGEKPKAEFEVTSLPARDEDQPCWDIYPVGGDMFRLAWEYFRNKQQAAQILNQLKLEAP